MAKSQGAFEKERKVLADMQELTANPDISNEAVKAAFFLLTDKYKILLDEIRVLTNVSDRLQSKLQSGNIELRKKSEQLEEANKHAQSARERAESSEQFKEQFLANMSHEIRTPMNAVLGMTRLLLKTQLDEQQRKYMDAIRHSSENLLVIINDILDLSKIEAGKMEFEAIPFSLREVAQGILDTLKFRVDEKGIALKVEMDSSMPQYLAGDPVRLSQIMLNLAGNAVKFTEKGSVTIRGIWKIQDDNSRTMLIEVQDTGIGIPEDRQQAVFESYSQAGTDTNRKFGGTGLGLTISKHLVEQQGGRIGLRSKTGEGTTFWFEIPYLETESQTEHSLNPDSQDELIERLRGIRVLLVEDNPFNQIVAVDTLKDLVPDIRITVAEHGQECLEYLQEHNVDIVLMDCNMPVMDGFEATRHIRAKEKNKSAHLSILAMTAGITRPEVDACIEAGMDDVIGKPFEPLDLLNKIYQLRQKFKTGARAPVPEPHIVLKNKRILIADDNPFNRIVAEDLLRDLLPDSIFEQSENGLISIEKHKLNPFDIILTDLNMPEMDGWQSTLEIRVFDKQVRILAMTAGNSVREKESCRSIGMNGYVTKPFDSDKLLKNLAYLLFHSDPDIFV